MKGLEETAPVVTPEALRDGNVIPGALRVDNGATRVAAKIHEAVGQLETVRFPQILVLVNDACGLDKFDLQDALQGFLSTDDGGTFSTMRPSSRLRMEQDRTKIDLYVWVDEGSGEHPRLVTASAVGRTLRSRFFLEQSAERAG